MTRLVVVDDHPVVRDGVRLALEGTGIQIVAEALTAAEAVATVRREHPDVVLMDLGLPDLSGIEAIRQIRDAELDPAPAVLAFTMSADPATVLATLRAGATGYVVKGADRAGLLSAIEVVAAGNALYLDAEVAGSVLAPTSPIQLPDGSPLGELTRRELAVLDLLANGWGNQAIAARLGIASKTVRNHVSRLLTKLQVSTRSEAIVRARRLGLGAPD